jgi:hypothetical protein
MLLLRHLSSHLLLLPPPLGQLLLRCCHLLLQCLTLRLQLLQLLARRVVLRLLLQALLLQVLQLLLCGVLAVLVPADGGNQPLSLLLECLLRQGTCAYVAA